MRKPDFRYTAGNISFCSHQLIMGTALNNLSLLKNHDTIGVSYGGQTMCDNKGCSSAHQLIHTILNNALGTGIDELVASSRESSVPAVCNGCTRDRKKLPLTLGQIRTVSGQHCVIALRQTHNESVRIRQFCCCYNLVSSVASSFPKAIFSLTVPVNRCVSCKQCQAIFSGHLFDLSNVDLIARILPF